MKEQILLIRPDTGSKGYISKKGDPQLPTYKKYFIMNHDRFDKDCIKENIRMN